LIGRTGRDHVAVLVEDLMQIGAAHATGRAIPIAVAVGVDLDVPVPWLGPAAQGGEAEQCHH
jgi:hypothetical protein